MSILSKRILATCVDYIIFFSICYLYIDSFGEIQMNGTKVVSGLMVIPILVLWILYFILMEITFNGTISHLTLNLKVVSMNGENADYFQIIKRRLADPVDLFIFGLPAYLTVKNSPNAQRIGDIWGKTKVISS